MTGQAQITSVEAIESFRGKLIVYLAQARSVLDEAANELSRTRLWLQNDQRSHWDHELRLRARRLEEARQELFNAKLSQFQDSTALHLMAVQRAQRAVQDAESHLGALKKWDRELENRAAPLMKQTEQLQGFLATDMSRAVAYLDQALKALEAYRTTTSPGTGKPAAVEPAKTSEAK
jgi:LmbE family N-acetylglucosaminyl deacetylase